MTANRLRFRAWDGVEMHYTNADQTVWVGGENASVVAHGQPSLCVDTIMQSTGLTDKNGVEIYEGDVLDWAVRDGYFPLAVIRYFVTPYNSGFDFGSSPRSKLASVIGNIYENPELLEVQP